MTDKIVYLSADLEDQYTIAQANAKLDKNGTFADSRVACRCRGDFPIKSPKEIEQTAGIMGYLCSLLGENGVNIVEEMSCWTDTIFLVQEKDLGKVMELLKF